MNDSKILYLQSLAEGCVDSDVRAEIDVQIAYHASRVGDFDLAHNIIDKIRFKSDRENSPSVGIWIILVEGILSYFESLDVGSYDRFKRAHALSSMLELNDLRALTSAWLAHAEFGLQQYDSMVKSINDCLRYCSGKEHLASSRIGIVLASCYHYAGEIASSRVWYESARQSAVFDGDRATVGAIMYNRAALALTRYRVEECLCIAHTFDVAEVASAVLSASNFNTRTNNKALNPLLRMCEARLAKIEHRFEDAIEIFDDIRRTDSIPLTGVIVEVFDVEHALCLVKLNEIGRRGFRWPSLRIESITKLHCDDRAIFLSELLIICKVFPIEDSGINFHELYKDAGCDYIDGVKRLQTALQGVVQKK